jgi:hypothetical protein
MNQYWKEHLKTCSYGSSSDERAKDEDGKPLFYAREFPIDTKKLLHDLTDFTCREHDMHATKIRGYFICERALLRPGLKHCIVRHILLGHVPVRAESISEENVADVILENVVQRESLLEEARMLVTRELDRLLPPAPESWERCGETFGTVKRRPVPHDKKEGERVLTEALFAALDAARTITPKSYKRLCEHALVLSDHCLALPLVSNLLHADYLSDAFDVALEARLRKHLRELRKTT